MLLTIISFPSPWNVEDKIYLTYPNMEKNAYSPIFAREGGCGGESLPEGV